MIFIVSSYIRCICGVLKNKCRILVTHQLQYLKAADQILVLMEVGSCMSKRHLILIKVIKVDGKLIALHLNFTDAYTWEARCDGNY